MIPQSHSWVNIWKAKKTNKSMILSDACTPVFIAALFTVFMEAT